MDDFSFSVLKDIGKRESVSITELAAIYNLPVDCMEDPVLYLKEKKYVGIERNYANLYGLTSESLIGQNTPLVISYTGKIAIETEHKARKQHKFNEFRAWVTLAIAGIALIISIIALQG